MHFNKKILAKKYINLYDFIFFATYHIMLRNIKWSKILKDRLIV